MKDRDRLLAEQTQAQRERVLLAATEYIWHEMGHLAPTSNGHYLVVQRHADERARAYRWVRYWHGGGWYDAKEDKYGPVTHWMPLPPVPASDLHKRRRRFD